MNPDLQCHICGISCVGGAQLQQHFAGKKHKAVCQQKGLEVDDFRNSPVAGNTNVKCTTSAHQVNSQNTTEYCCKQNSVGYSEQQKLQCVLQNDCNRLIKTSTSQVSHHTDLSEQNASTAFACDTCSITCSGQKQFEEHLQGKRHLHKLRSIAMCNSQPVNFTQVTESTAVCSVNQATVLEHNQPSVHKGLQASGNAQPLEATKLSPVTTTAVDNSEFSCKICGITCNGKVPFQEHLKSKHHLQKENSSKGDQVIHNSPSTDSDLQKQKISNDSVIEDTSERSENNDTSSIVKSSSITSFPSLSVTYTKNVFATRQPQNFSCFICDIHCFGKQPFEQHLRDVNHQQKLQQNLKQTSLSLFDEVVVSTVKEGISKQSDFSVMQNTLPSGLQNSLLTSEEMKASINGSEHLQINKQDKPDNVDLCLNETIGRLENLCLSDSPDPIPNTDEILQCDFICTSCNNSYDSFTDWVAHLNMSCALAFDVSSEQSHLEETNISEGRNLNSKLGNRDFDQDSRDLDHSEGAASKGENANFLGIQGQQPQLISGSPQDSLQKIIHCEGNAIKKHYETTDGQPLSEEQNSEIMKQKQVHIHSVLQKMEALVQWLKNCNIPVPLDTRPVSCEPLHTAPDFTPLAENFTIISAFETLKQKFHFKIQIPT